MDWTAIIIGVGSGVATGTLAAFITPWAQWAVDIRRDRQKNRLKFVHDWNMYANAKSLYTDILSQNADFYSLIRKLTPAKRRQLEILLQEYRSNWGKFEKEEIKSLIRDYDEYSVAIIVDVKKEELGKALKDFLLEQIAELRERWKLL